MPEVTTRSPGFKPVSIAQSRPARGRRLTNCCRTTRPPAELVEVFQHINRIAVRRAEDGGGGNRENGISSGNNTSIRANMPGRSSCSSLFKGRLQPDAAGGGTSRSGLIAVRVAEELLVRIRVRGHAHDFQPVFTRARSCCGSEKSPYTGASDCRDTMNLPASRYSPFVDLADAELAGERRADDFLGDGGADGIGVGLLLLQGRFPPWSSSACDTVFSRANFCAREVGLGHSTWASSARNCASSWRCRGSRANRLGSRPRRIQRRFCPPCPEFQR
jgi:hypothetical protein